MMIQADILCAAQFAETGLGTEESLAALHSFFDLINLLQNRFCHNVLGSS